MSDLKGSLQDYVSTRADVTPPPLDALRSRARTVRLRRYGAASIAALTIAGAASVPAVLNSPEPTSATAQERLGSPDRSDSGSASATTVVKLDGARIAPYSLPTFAEFAGSGAATRAVFGVVTATSVRVTEDGSNSVETIMTIKTEDPLGIVPSQQLTVSEVGGVVPMRQVREDFESKVGPLSEAQLDSVVDYTDGTTHPVVGQKQLLLLRSLPAGSPAEYVSMGRLTQVQGTNRYDWAGEAPNEAWTGDLTAPQLVQVLGNLLRVG